MKTIFIDRETHSITFLAIADSPKLEEKWRGYFKECEDSGDVEYEIEEPFVNELILNLEKFKKSHDGLAGRIESAIALWESFIT